MPTIIKEMKMRLSGAARFSSSNKLTIIITVIIVITIIFLSFLYYYFAIRSITAPEFSETVPMRAPTLPETPPATATPTAPEIPAAPETPPQPQLPEGQYTKVISYFPPANLPKETRSGKCLANSIAQPYRQDTWRCVVSNKIYDPCFVIREDLVICQMNPLVESDIFLVKLSEPIAPRVTKDNWAWFLDFDDGTYCAPYTGRRPQVENEEVYYGCKSKNNETVVILGELKKGVKWTARTATLFNNGQEWKIKSVKELEIKTAWQ